MSKNKIIIIINKNMTPKRVKTHKNDDFKSVTSNLNMPFYTFL